VRHKVSWQNETHLRFALKGAHVGQIEELLALIDIKPLSLKRLRLGRIPLSSLPVGYWRYAATWERI
jgi:23S rRNA pseudouridine2604 synthase